jgi:hypothetical protein
MCSHCEGAPKKGTEDAERLERKRAAARRYVERHKDEINERRRRKRQDPAYREEILAAGRDYYQRRKEEIGRRSRERWRTDAAYREKLLSRSREWNRNNRLTALYGMTRAEYEQMFKRQGGVCAICKRTGVPLCVDHCHRTAEIRGLLCHRCNLALGCSCDDPEILLAAVAYLRAGRTTRSATGPPRIGEPTSHCETDRKRSSDSGVTVR